MLKKIMFSKIIEVVMYVLQIVILIKVLYTGIVFVFPNFEFLTRNVYVFAYLNIGVNTAYGNILSFITHATYFFLFNQIRLLASDMKNGLKFVKRHVNKLRLIALLVFIVSAFKTLYSYVEPEIHYIGDTISFISRIIYTDGLLLWPLVILFLAQVFEHGVEVQTDSDMTV